MILHFTEEVEKHKKIAPSPKLLRSRAGPLSMVLMAGNFTGRKNHPSLISGSAHWEREKAVGDQCVTVTVGQ